MAAVARSSSRSAFSPRLASPQRRSTKPVSVPTIDALSCVDNAPIKQTPKSSESPGYRYLNTEEMSRERWTAISDNPRQRDVVERINKGRAGHLMKFDPVHRKVALGAIRIGNTGKFDLYKADGHTRAFVWSKGLAEGPQTVVAEIWECDDVEAVKQLYNKFDSYLTTENGSDGVTGAIRETGAKFESALMRGGEYSAALRELWYYTTRTTPTKGDKLNIINTSFKKFLPQLLDLDDCKPSKKRFPTPVIMAAILTLRADPDKAYDFWVAYGSGMAEKSRGRRNAIQVFEDRIFGTGTRPGVLTKRETNPSAKYRAVMCEAIAAINVYAKNESYSDKRGYTAIDTAELRKYVDHTMKGGK